MNSSDEDDWSEYFQELKDNVRNHAGYFSWEKNKAIEETGVVQSLSESLENNSKLFFHDCISREEDPPDWK